MADQTPDISASALLKSLEDEVVAKLQAIAGIRTALGLPAWDMGPRSGSGPDRVQENPPATGMSSTAFFRMSFPLAIQKYLELVRKPQGPKAIADGLRAGGFLSNANNFAANVSTALTRLAAQEIVVSTPHGWGMASWYPNRPKPDTKPKKVKRAAKPHARAKTLPAPSAAPFKVKRKKEAGRSEYQQFVSDKRAVGLNLSQIAPLWAAHKAGKR